MLARDLANTPPAHLTAPRIADVAVAVGADRGLEVEVFDQAALTRLGCGGLLGVNGGSADEARMVKLTYRPASAPGQAHAPRHLALVAKGIMYDSGGISLKPSDAVHATMKNDMSGAAAVLAAMSVLGELGCPNTVTGYLMCTDNMPSGTALKLGDVITMYGGTTVEVINTDAEGRLVMADGLVLAAESHPDAIIDIATLTGATMRALGTWIAGVMGNDQGLIDQVRAASARTDERTWPFPLERRYRRELDSDVADLKNMGGANAGQITAALFLEGSSTAARGPTSTSRAPPRPTRPSPGGRRAAPGSGRGCSRRSHSTSRHRPELRATGLTRSTTKEDGMTAAAVALESDGGRGFSARLLDGIERLGNKVPHPAIMFFYLILFVIVLSHVLFLLGVSVTEEIAVPVPQPVAHDFYEDTVQPGVYGPGLADPYGDQFEIKPQTIAIQSLLTTEGIRFIFTGFVANFAGFGVVAVTFVAMMGAGVAEGAGLMSALIRKLVAVSPRWMLSFILIMVGVLSSVATDAGYLILIPLGAAAFASVGRHPLAGMAACFAGVGSIFGVNLILSPSDAMITEITNEAIGLIPGQEPITIVANWFFAIACSIILAIVAAVLTERIDRTPTGPVEAGRRPRRGGPLARGRGQGVARPEVRGHRVPRSRSC